MKLNTEEFNFIKNINKNYKLSISVELMQNNQKKYENNHYITKNYINYFFGDFKITKKPIYGAYIIKNNGVYEDIHFCNKNNNFFRHNSESNFSGLNNKNLAKYFFTCYHSLYLDFKNILKTDKGISFIPFWNEELEKNDSVLEKEFNSLIENLQTSGKKSVQYNFTKKDKKTLIQVIEMNAKRSPYLRFRKYEKTILNMATINKNILYNTEFSMFANYSNQNLVDVIKNNPYSIDLEENFEINIIYDQYGRFVLTDNMVFEVNDDDFDFITKKVKKNNDFNDLNQYIIEGEIINISQDDSQKFLQAIKNEKKFDRLIIPISNKIIIDFSRKASNKKIKNPLTNTYSIAQIVNTLNMLIVSSCFEFYTDKEYIYEKYHKYINNKYIKNTFSNFYVIPISVKRLNIEKEKTTLTFNNSNLIMFLNEVNFLTYKKEENYQIKNLIFNLIERNSQDDSIYIRKNYIDNK